MTELVQQGKVRFLGTVRSQRRIHPARACDSSNYRAPIGVLALGRAIPIRNSSDLPRVWEFGFVPYSPLGAGFLTGKIQKPEDLPEDDYRRSTPRFQGENFQRNLDIVNVSRK